MINIEGVTKTIKNSTVLDEVSIDFEYGKIYGLYGQNGSGKTMLLRLIAGLLVPTKGRVMIDGKQLHKDISFPENVGIVIEHMEMLPKFSALENLKILSRIKKIAKEEDMEEALVRVGLDPKSTLKVKKYSLGMKQRLNIAQAIFEHQKIILLDEPTNALDEEGQRLVYKVLLEEKQKGALIIIATHHKIDLESICDEVIKVSSGKVIKEL